MLVVPALLSLKPQVVEKGVHEVLELLSTVIKKLKDSEEIVAKTAKKLVLELQKCYPTFFDQMVVGSLKNDADKNICRAIIGQNEEELSRLLYSQTIGGSTIQSEHPKVHSQPVNARQDEETKSTSSYARVNQQKQLGAKDLSIVGKEIL